MPPPSVEIHSPTTATASRSTRSRRGPAWTPRRSSRSRPRRAGARSSLVTAEAHEAAALALDAALHASAAHAGVTRPPVGQAAVADARAQGDGERAVPDALEADPADRIPDAEEEGDPLDRRRVLGQDGAVPRRPGDERDPFGGLRPAVGLRELLLPLRLRHHTDERVVQRLREQRIGLPVLQQRARRLVLVEQRDEALERDRSGPALFDRAGVLRQQRSEHVHATARLEQRRHGIKPARGQARSEKPPSTISVWPRTISASGEQRKATAAATSSGSTSRPAAVRARPSESICSRFGK